jgi:hypothetical protein
MRRINLMRLSISVLAVISALFASAPAAAGANPAMLICSMNGRMDGYRAFWEKLNHKKEHRDTDRNGRMPPNAEPRRIEEIQNTLGQ